MTTAYPYSDERVFLPSAENSPTPEFTAKMREFINDYAEYSYSFDRTRNLKELYREMSHPHGYKPADPDFPESNPWGTIRSFVATDDATSLSHNKVIRNCEAVGFIVLNEPGPYDTVKTLEPKLRRHLHFNSPHTDAAAPDIYLIDYTTDPAAEQYNFVLAGSKPNLKQIAPAFAFRKYRPQHGHAYPIEDETIESAEQKLDDLDVNYARYENTTNSTPLYESFSSNTHNTVITKYTTENWTDTNAYHKYDPDTGGACCGSLQSRGYRYRSNDDTRILTEQTAKHVLNNKPCQHAACSLPDLTEERAQQTL